jgi:hypothetical protein
MNENVFNSDAIIAPLINDLIRKLMDMEFKYNDIFEYTKQVIQITQYENATRELGKCCKTCVNFKPECNLCKTEKLEFWGPKITLSTFGMEQG